MKWNPAQKSAIEERDKNILVSAAAGSGKTAVLVERIKQLIVKDGIGVDQMLVVTFTKAAAGEMKERITKAIADELQSGNPFLREQLSRIHSANISTFHSFCLDIIKRYFYMIDIKPDVRICDETQKTILQIESLDQVFEINFQDKNSNFNLFLHKYADSRNENHVRTMIMAVYDFIQSIPNSFQWLASEVEQLQADEERFKQSWAYQYVQEQITVDLERAMDYLVSTKELVDENNIESISIKAQKDINLLEELISLMDRQNHDLFAVAITGIKFETFVAKKEDKLNFEEIKEEVKYLRDQGKSIIKNIAEKYMYKSLNEIVEEIRLTYDDAKCLQGLVEQFHQMYGEKKREKGLIDFNDAEHFALKILEDQQVAAEYRDKFQCIFVDEYQDSNVVQETLIGKIKRENNLFMVGDIKQSIYKFRLAEPEIFMGKYEKYRNRQVPMSIKIDLNQNFRSKQGVIDFTNMIFECTMTKDTCGMDYDEDAKLYNGLGYSGQLAYPAEVHMVDESMDDDMADDIDDEIKEMKKTELEAMVASRIIKQNLGKPIFDDKRGIERPMTYRDMVILFRAVKGPGAMYQEIFDKEGIPIYAELADGYFDTIEIGTFLNLLKIIDNKKQDIPLLSILRSGLFGFTTGELVEIRLKGKNIPYHEAFRKASEGDDKCKKVIEKIASWKQLAGLMPLEELLWEIMRTSGYYDYVGAMPSGLQRQANLRVLVDKAVDFQSGHTKGLFGFITYVEQLKKTGVSMGQVKLLGENDQVVRMMTIHKSKGLEFPLVIVGGVGRKFNMMKDSYKVNLHKDMGIGLRYVEPETFAYSKTFVQEVIEQREKREAIAEEMRILYVALTRARDKLVLLGTLKDVEKSMEKYRLKGPKEAVNAGCFFDWIIPSLEGSQIMPIIHNREHMTAYKEAANSHKEQIIHGINNGFEVENDSWKEKIHRRLSWEYGHKQASKLPSKYAVSDMKDIHTNRVLKNIPALDIPEELNATQSRLTATERGTAMHTVIQHLDLTAWSVIGDGSNCSGSKIRTVPKEEKIVKQIDQMVDLEMLTRDEADSVSITKVVNFLDSPIGRRMAKADECYKEQAFNLKKSAGDYLDELKGTDETILIQGAIDCYFREGDKYILVDYKTDFVDKNDGGAVENIVQRYRPQLELYKSAIEEIKGIKVAETYLYLFSIEKAVAI